MLPQKIGIDRRSEPVRVFEFHASAIGKLRRDSIALGLALECGHKEAVGLHSHHGGFHAIRHNTGRGCVRKKRANFPTVFYLVRAKHTECISVVSAGDGRNLFTSHVPLLWQ